MSLLLPRSLITKTLTCKCFSMDFSHESPAPHQLEHVRTRITETVPLMFRQRLDYTFYRNDVVCVDQILRIERRGLEQLMSYFGILGTMGQVLFPHIEMELISAHPVIDQGSVRCRWRIKYVSFPRLLVNPRLFRFDYRVNHLSWYDGYSVFSVDGNGKVYKVTLQKMIQDDGNVSIASASTVKQKLQAA
ncbi:unnamed protein product [Caenorhabditis bovis]|uniref:Uncharacterized protein n=1 Tax=Caenorhabditis bovis TaxID=2654633 RepID=A0A8S1F490_9PELO|nr:unnamed protein product [Caenorhabditis bovis]